MAQVACPGCGAIFEDREGADASLHGIFARLLGGLRRGPGSRIQRCLLRVSPPPERRCLLRRAAPGTAVTPEHAVRGFAPHESLPGARARRRAGSGDGFPSGRGQEQGTLHLARSACIARLRHRQKRPRGRERDCARKARPRLGRVRVVRLVFSSRHDSRMAGSLGAAWRVRSAVCVFPGGGSHAISQTSGPRLPLSADGGSLRGRRGASEAEGSDSPPPRDKVRGRSEDRWIASEGVLRFA